VGDLGLSPPSAASISSPTAEAKEGKEAKLVLAAQQGSGLQIKVAYSRQNGRPSMELFIENQSQTPVALFKMKIRQNIFGIALGGAYTGGPIAPGASGRGVVQLTSNEESVDPSKTQVEFAMKTELGVIFWKDRPPMEILFEEEGRKEKEIFPKAWNEFGDSKEHSQTFNSAVPWGDLKARLEPLRVFHIASRSNAKIGRVLYFSLRVREHWVLLEFGFKEEASSSCKLSLRTDNPNIAQLVISHLTSLLS
jgi:hypothetical protein